MRIAHGLTLLLALGSAACRPAVAAPPATPLALAQAFAAATRTKDRGRMRALLHPAVAACITASTRPYFDRMTADFHDAPPLDARISVQPASAWAIDPPGAPPGMFTFPVRPTRQFEIDWMRKGYASVSTIRAIAPAAGGWYIVYPCPTEQGMRQFRRHEVDASAQQARQKLAAAVAPQLRSELRHLLAAGRKIDAAKRYQAATGADLTTAVQVANALEPPSR